VPTPKAQQDCDGTCEDPNHGKRHCDEPIPPGEPFLMPFTMLHTKIIS